MHSRVVLCLIAGWLTPALAQEKVKDAHPLARASDIRFDVSYNASELALGDLLYARASLTNLSSRTVKVDRFDSLVIRAKSPNRTEIVSGFGEYPGGDSLVELESGQSIEFIRCLDFFGNDGYEDGNYDPFDQTLSDQIVTLIATRSVVAPRHMGDRDYRELLLRDEQDLTLLAPIIGREKFDSALEASDQANEPGFVGIPFGQTSYLFTQTDDARLSGFSAQRYQSAMSVLTESVPRPSTTQRAATLVVLLNEFLAENQSNERSTTAEIKRLLDECHPIERGFLLKALSELMNQRINTGTNAHAKRNAERFMQRLGLDRTP